MQRHVTSLPLSAEERSRLQQKNIHFCEDTVDDRISELIVPPPAYSAIHFWEQEGRNSGVPVFHEGLDGLLGGGLPPRSLCLVSGAPGSGKTAMCLQLSCDACMPVSLGGAGGQALFICTDSGFAVERVHEVALGSSKLAPDELNIDFFTSNIFVSNVLGVKNLLEALDSLPVFLSLHKDIRLIVIDSYSFPFLCGEHETLKRTQLVHQGLTAIRHILQPFNVTVVITVQLTTLVSGNGEVSKVVPCLGEGLRHRTHIHLMLEGKKVHLLHSPAKPPLSIAFEITEDGFR